MSAHLRYAVIGVGANVFFAMHLPALQHATVEVVGVTDLNEEVSRRRAEELGCPSFPNYTSMLQTRPDVAVILTPHPLHAPMAVDCLHAGCNVLVEKPMAVHVGEADAMVKVADETGRILAVNFQQRLQPEALKAVKVVRSGVVLYK